LGDLQLFTTGNLDCFAKLTKRWLNLPDSTRIAQI
jgi:hypothetical protein